MFLRSLTMKGFKSFADATVLEFETGITVVVGPNGSGKSNVVDATTWVLGAQSPRALRSQKMEDVIFAGTSTRPALGRAEVSLTIDNSSGRLPVDMAEVTITRTLFRSGESEYAINGTPCRLLDVQELLSDSGVGRQQHMIIGQGQLDSVLSNRPEDRRSVVEEAAGVLKHRRRRERAERRLAATQENLERLGDLVREVRRQVRPLERQAAAARSAAALADELQTIRMYLAGRELKHLARRHESLGQERAQVSASERELQQRLSVLDEEASEATARLSSGREGDLAATVARVQGLVERSRGTLGVLRERSHGLRVALDAAADIDVVSTLEAEAARLVVDLGGAQEDEHALDEERRSLDLVTAQLDEESRERLGAFGSGVDPRDADEALTRAGDRAAMLRKTVEQHARVAAQRAARRDALGRRESESRETAARLEQRVGEAEEEQRRLEEHLASAGEAAQAAAETLSEAGAAAEAANKERYRSAARAEALHRALDELRNQPGRKALAGSVGVVGALADLVLVDPGWEAAFEASVLGAEGAVVVEGERAARSAVALLEGSRVSGDVLALPAPGWAVAAREPQGGGVETGAGTEAAVRAGTGAAEPVRPHVRAAPGPGAAGLERLLDRLLDRVVCAARWEDAVDLVSRAPEMVAVTASGDRFSVEGWKVRRGAAVVTASAVEAAAVRAREDEARAEIAERGRADAEGACEQGRRALADAQRAADRHRGVVSGARAEQARVRESIAAVRADIESIDEETVAAESEARALSDDLSSLEGSLPELRQRAEAAHRAREAMDAVRSELDQQRRTLADRRRGLEVRVASLEERRRVLAKRRDEVERRLDGHAEERRLAESRRARLERDLAVVRSLEELVAASLERLSEVHRRISGAYREQVAAARAGGERLDALHRERTQAERQLDELRDRGARFDLELAEVSMRATSLTEMVERELGSSPEQAVEAPCPDVPEGSSPETRAQELTNKLASIGPVNPLALEELSELEARAAELEGQVQDVKTARRELQQVVRHLDQEITESFTSAMADVNEHFSTLAATLFPGGTGRLVLTDPENPLETGIDIEVRPAGRNLRRVSLFSGGERSLVALAFLFAVFRSRPSPFYLMDEVEAALDDVNLHRFLDLLREFRGDAQLIIVSHQKRTMEMADALYGVTMVPGGSSQVVSQKVESTTPTSTGPAAAVTTAAATGPGPSDDAAGGDAPLETAGSEQSVNGVNGENGGDHSGVGLIAAD